MAQYVDKAAILNELNRLYDLEYDNISVLSCGKKIMLRQILIFLNTLKVKDIEESGVGKFNEKIYKDGITWLFGHHCLECEHLTFAKHEVKELAKYFYELSCQEIAESFAKIIRGNLSTIKSVQDKFEQLYKEITGDKMYQGFKD